MQSVVTTLNLQLALRGLGFDVVPKHTTNLEAYDYYLRALEDWLAGKLSPDSAAKARHMFEKAVELDPDYADAYAALGFLDTVLYLWLRDSDPNMLGHAADLANKAISLDQSNAGAYAVRGWVGAVRGQRDEAFADIEKAISLDPNSAFAWFARADINNILVGKPEETLASVQRARRLDPLHPETGSLQEGLAYNVLGQYAKAIDALKRDERTDPHNPWVHVNLVFAYSELGHDQEVRAEVAEVSRASPGFSLERWQKTFPKTSWQDPGLRHFLTIVRKAGLK